MLREYVVSEAMHALGIPTTRSLAVVATGRPVQRETLLPGAVLARVAEQPPARGQLPVRPRHRRRRPASPPRRPRDRPPPPRRRGRPSSRYLALFEAVVAAQASLVAQWMLVGFVHGVMNTDNMTISGETIDYGPCAFMDAFDPATVYSSIDEGGRYAYGNQPVVAEWNLARLAEALLPLLDDDAGAGGRARGRSRSARSAAQYGAAWSAGMHAKLGLRDGLDDDVTAPLVDELLGAAAGRATSTTRRSSGASARPPAATPSRRAALFLDLAGFDAWVERWRALAPDADADGPGQPGLHPAQPPGGGGAGRRDRRRPGAAGTAARRRRPTRSTSGPASSATPPPARRTSARYRTFCGT